MCSCLFIELLSARSPKLHVVDPYFSCVIADSVCVIFLFSRLLLIVLMIYMFKDTFLNQNLIFSLTM